MRRWRYDCLTYIEISYEVQRKQGSEMTTTDELVPDRVASQ